MATYQEQIAKYEAINKQRQKAEQDLDRLCTCLLNRLLPLEQSEGFKVTPELLAAIVKGVADAAEEQK